MAEWRLPLAQIGRFLVPVLLLGLLFFSKLWAAQRWVAEERISFGEKSLIPGNPSQEKQAGMNYIKAKDWKNAQHELKKSLENKPNDPETLIFLNNARINFNDSRTIAVSVPISKNKDASLEILRGVAQAQKEIYDDGGINEKKVFLKVAIASDDDDPEVAKQVATALADNRDVLGVVGHYASGVTIAAKDIYTSKKLVAITPISTSVCLTNTLTSISNSICSKDSDRSKNSEPYVFRTVPSDSVTAKALADYMLQDWKKKNVAVFYNSSSDYSMSLMSEFKTVVKQKGGQVSKEFNLNEQNFSAASSVEQAIKPKQGTEVVMLAADTKTLPQALQVIKVAKENKLNILAGDDVYTPDTLKAGNVAVGMVVAAFWHIDNAPNKDFVCKSKNLWGNAEVNWRTALAYDATKALIAAIRKNPTRTGVQQTLLSSNFKAGASGNIKFSSSGDRTDDPTDDHKNPVELVKIVPTNNSSTPYKFVPVAPRKDKPSSDCKDK